jgi:ABC-type polysaccharide/polyol phosphate transport system ATPase subunit
MSSEPVVELRGVSKVYRVYQRPFDRLREAVTGGCVHREIRVLSGIDLDVVRGRTVGIIGRNGSGKSTLLKLVAGTLQPTSGSVRVRGTVAALLELGSGFNHDETGRENVFINAGIHGLSRAEIARRYERIAEFSELGDFLDQPVKTYSSGMVMRLAFATAMQAERDLLIVDEALAVGDEMFQRKCMAAIESIKSSGRTILFVSHSLETVKALCDHVVLLEQGRVAACGAPSDVAHEYARLVAGLSRRPGPVRRIARPEQAAEPAAAPRTPPPLPRVVQVPVELLEVGKEEFPYGTGEADIAGVETRNARGEPTTSFPSGDLALLHYTVEFARRIEQPICGMAIKTLEGICVYGTNTLYQDIEIGACEPGEGVAIEFRIPLRLGAGNYYITVGCGEMRDGKPVIFLRRCDVLLVRVLPVDHVSGIADLGARIVVERGSQSRAA